ncbi:uncharacterized protein LOC112904948 [Agrilus planipennis]|uniref:Uncharacterized protein LOC112904948 n=1 Tax=Agrilus planipennis TaxID=224129 RepID=A0A7F5R7X5_AGRPL|nr:uncharacterized protein LOC112904948 [Agrilus planipennis]
MKAIIHTIIIPFLFHFSQSYTITAINSSSGIFYNHLGKAKVTNQKFTLLTFVNVSHIDNHIQTINMLYYKSLGICNKLTSKHIDFHCQNQLQYINTKLKFIKNDYNIIAHQVIGNRKKRGLVDGIGDAFKWLFGTPDAEDAQFYTDSIKSLIGNQKQTELLMQQQVRIVQSTISNFNNSLQILNQNTKTLNENIMKFDEFISQTNSFEEKLQLENQISQHIITLVEMTDEVQNILGKYIDGLSLVNKGIISYHILNPEDLRSELKTISIRHNLPLEPTLENALVYFKLMKIKAFIKNELLVIAFEIPIVNSLLYDLYGLYPLFTPHQSDPYLFSYIEPSKPYILLSVTRTVFSSLNNLQKCQEYLPNQWLCDQVTISKRIDHPICEIQLFFKEVNHIPKNCQVKHIYADTELWHKINNNKWIYVLSKPTRTNILC